MSKQTIRFRIRQDGIVEEQVEGVTGDVCQKLTEEIENALGDITRRIHKPEYYNKLHIAIDKDIGFKWNDITDSYELVTDVQTWDEPIPVEMFLDKLTQLYASKMIVSVSKQKGYEVVEYAKLNDGSIEVVCERWN